MAPQPILTGKTISKITEAEKCITHLNDPIADGPTAMAQKHAGEKIDGKVLRDITTGEKKITHEVRPVAGGPTAVMQSHLSKVSMSFPCGGQYLTCYSVSMTNVTSKYTTMTS